MTEETIGAIFAPDCPARAGSVVGSRTNIYPLSSVRGFVPAGSIYKRQGEVVEKIEG